MKTCLTILFVLAVTTFSKAQELSLSKIVERSVKYYSTIQAGSLSIFTTFKSSIAESFQKDNAEISFCKGSNKYNISGGGFDSYLSGNKYFYIDNNGKRFMDFSRNKSYKEQRMDYLKQYPQFDEHYFDRFKNGQFRVERRDSLIQVYDFREHFFFDTSQYSIVRYESYDISEHGLQIKRWEFIKQEYFTDCKIPFDEKQLAGYAKVKSFGPSQSMKKVIGEKFSSISGIDLLRLDDGNLVGVDSSKGRYILLDFFYQSCMPCIQSFPEIKKLYPKVVDGNLNIISVDPVLADSSTAMKFKSRYQLKHGIISGTEAVRLNSLFNPNGIFPFYLLIDSRGIIVKIIEGYDAVLSRTVSNSMN